MDGVAGTLRSRWPSVAAGLVVASVVVGCSGSDPPAAGRVPSDPPSSTSSSGTPTETPVAQQVEAAVRAYYAEVVRAARTSDVSVLKTLVTESCPCYRTVRVIAKNHAQGETAPDISIEVRSVRVHDAFGDSASAEVSTLDHAYDVVNAGGLVVEHIPRNRTHLDLSLIRAQPSGWVVANFFNLGDKG